MPQSTAKAIALSRDLADKYRKRFPTGSAGLDTVREAFDANGWPLSIAEIIRNARHRRFQQTATDGRVRHQ